MSNTKYFLLGVGMPGGRERSEPSADLLWETDLEPALPDPHDDLLALQLEQQGGPKELGTSALSCPNAARARDRDMPTSQVQHRPPFLCLLAGFTYLDGVCHILTNRKITVPSN